MRQAQLPAKVGRIHWASAGRHPTLTASNLQNDAAGGLTQLQAGQDLTLATVQAGSSNQLQWQGNNARSDSQSQDVGSSIASDQATTLKATGNVTLAAAQNSSSESHSRDEKKSGLMSSGGLGVTVGKVQQGNANTVTTTQAVGSTVGSVQGDVSRQASKDLQFRGSDVIAGQDILPDGRKP